MFVQRVDDDQGPILVTVEYRIDPNDPAPFLAAMQEIGLERKRDGAYAWNVFEDWRTSAGWSKPFCSVVARAETPAGVCDDRRPDDRASGAPVFEGAAEGDLSRRAQKEPPETAQTAPLGRGGGGGVRRRLYSWRARPRDRRQRRSVRPSGDGLRLRRRDGENGRGPRRFGKRREDRSPAAGRRRSHNRSIGWLRSTDAETQPRRAPAQPRRESLAGTASRTVRARSGNRPADRALSDKVHAFQGQGCARNGPSAPHF